MTSVRARTALALVLALAHAGWTAERGSRPAQEFSLRAVSRDVIKDTGQAFSYPAHVRSRDILPLLSLAVATGALIAFDEAIYRSFKDYQSAHPWVDDVSPVITQGGVVGAWGAAGLFLGAGLLLDDHKARDTGLLAAEAIAESTLVIQIIKGLTGRWRPQVADGVDSWEGPRVFFKRMGTGEESQYDAFPSGHTAAAFSLATVVAMQYKKTVWVPVLAYTLAAATGLSRLTEDKHWMSDVLVGAVLGNVIAQLVVRNHRRRYHVLPMVTAWKGTYSLGLRVGLN